MDNHTFRNFLKTIWQECQAKNTTYSSNQCSTYATQEIVFVSVVDKKINSDSLGILGSYKEEQNIVEGKYCKECAPVKFQFLKNVHLDQELKIKNIKDIDKILKFMNEKN